MPHTKLSLSAEEHTALEQLCHTGEKPYLRERAAAILQVAAGQTATAVAHTGLLQPRTVETVCRWLSRYRQAGLDGLVIRSGRGRKPAFSPSRAGRGGRA